MFFEVRLHKSHLGARILNDLLTGGLIIQLGLIKSNQDSLVS